MVRDYLSLVPLTHWKQAFWWILLFNEINFDWFEWKKIIFLFLFIYKSFVFYFISQLYSLYYSYKSNIVNSLFHLIFDYNKDNRDTNISVCKCLSKQLNFSNLVDIFLVKTCSCMLCNVWRDKWYFHTISIYNSYLKQFNILNTDRK